ncbi:MAG: hypothetical protein KBT01_01945 [Clostridiales bacterium]|nr:hypothetical protein [Candidatus Blautia equi]
MKKHTGWLLAGLMAGMIVFYGISVSAGEVLKEQVIWDAEDVVITADKMIETEGYKVLKLHAENNGTQDVSVMAEKVWVNSVAMEDDIIIELPAGESLDYYMEFDKVLLHAVGIDTVASIELSLMLFDPATYDDICAPELISLTTEGNEDYQQSYDESGDVIYDANGVKIIFKGRMPKYVIPVLAFFTENHSGADIYLDTDEVLLNGAESDLWIYDHIPDGRASLHLEDAWDFWEKPETLDSIEMNFSIRDYETAEFIDTLAYQNADPAFFSANQEEADYGEEDAELAALFDQTLTEQVIFDKEGVVITVKDISVKGRYVLLNLQTENKLEYPLFVDIQRFFVNKASVDVREQMEPAAGETCAQTIAIPADSLLEWGIDRIASLDFDLFVAAGSNFAGNRKDTIFESESIHLTTDGNEDYEQAFDVQGEVLYDSNGIRILSIGVKEGAFDKSIRLCVENQNDFPVYVGGHNITVDGKTKNEFLTYMFGCYAPSGTHAIGGITDDIGTDGDIAVDSVEMTLEIQNYETMGEIDTVQVAFDPVE